MEEVEWAKRMPSDPFYSSKDWYKAKARVKARDYGKACPLCNAILERTQAVSVDHEPRRKLLPPSRWCDMDVLQLVHKACHDRIKQSIEANMNKPTINEQGYPEGWA